MNYQRLVKIGFWALLLATIWCCMQQCDQGRLTEAFATVDTGIWAGQKELEQYNEALYFSFSSHVAADPVAQGREKLEELRQLQIARHRYNLFLDSLRNQMLTASGVSADQPLELQQMEPNRKVVKQVLLTGKPNAVMQIAERTSQLRAAMLALADNRPEMSASLTVDFTATPNGQYTFWKSPGDFQDLPLAGALAMLSNLQTAASAGMAMILHYCAYRFYSRDIVCYQFAPMASAKATYVLSGEPYEADIFLSHYAYKTEIIEVKVSGTVLPTKDGIAHYESVSNRGLGQKRFLVDITGSIVRENKRGFYRDTFRVTKEFAYEIVPRQAYIHNPPNIYYLYKGVENPISVSAAYGSSCNDIKVAATNAILENLGGGHFTLIPESSRSVMLEVGYTTLQYQVRPLPDPLAFLADQSSGHAISQAILATQTALNTRFPEDFDFPADCPIVDFHLTRFRPREDPEEVYNQGDKFNRRARYLLENTLPGDRLLFEDIRVQCSGDQHPRTIAALSLRVQ